jgi:Ni/Fe-hydrogenase subunit HybB-like protein
MTVVDLPGDAPVPVMAPGLTMRSLSEEVGEPNLGPKTPLWWWIAFGVSLLLLVVLVVAIIWTLDKAVGAWGINIPVAWGFAIVDYVWWIAAASGASFLSAMFYLTRSPWRTATHRIADCAAIATAAAAGIMPIMHLGRQGLFYWLFPYSTVMGVWPQVRSPLWWDFISLLCYIFAAAFYLYVGLLPDLATMRDLARDRPRQIFYGVLALGWRGSSREWGSFRLVYFIMAAVMAPMVVAVHGVVGLDFAGGLNPGWHSTQFPPYFFFGAIAFGFALVIMLAILIRWAYGLEDILTEYHLNAMAKIVLVGSLLLAYAYLWEGFGAIYGSNIADRTMFLDRISGLYAPSYWAKIALNVIIPQLLWFPLFRRRQIPLFAISLGIAVGSWLDPYVVIVQSLHRNYMPSEWGNYYPKLWDWALFAGSIGFASTLFLLMLRLLPIVSVAQLRPMIKNASTP